MEKISKLTTHGDILKSTPASFETEFREPLTALGEAGETLYAPDMAVQAEEIRDYFLEQGDLRYDAWISMSREAKIETLERLEAYTAEVSMRPAARVMVDEINPEMKKIGEKGEFRIEKGAESGTIVLDNDMLDDMSREGYCKTLNTLFSEGRHAYQWYNVNVQRVERNGEMVKTWEKNLNGKIGYYGAESVSDKRGAFEFKQQPTEVDARVFSEKVMETLELRE